MLRLILIVWAFVLALSASAPLSWALSGSIAGNGSEGKAQRKPHAWFLGERPIEWCLEVEGSLRSPSEIQWISDQVRASFATWRNYIRVKQLRNDWPAEVPFPHFNEHFNLGCGKGTELTIYIGVENEEVSTARAKYVNPRGFAELHSYDPIKGRGRGFIWIKSFAGRRGAFALQQEFSALLTHELGHVLGNGHVEGTLMRSDLAEVLDDGASLTQLERMHFHELIDQTRELYFANDSGVRSLAQVSIHPTESQRAVFRAALSREISAPLNQVFVQGEGRDKFKAKLYLGDYSGEPRSEPTLLPPSMVENWEALLIDRKLRGATFDVELFPESRMDLKVSDAVLFRSVYRSHGQSQENFLKVPSYSIEGQVLLEKNRVLPITYYRNPGDGEMLRLVAKIDRVPRLFYRAIFPAQSVR